MKTSANVTQMLELVRDESFASLWRKSCKQTLTWSMIKYEQAPTGYSLEEAHTIITALRHRFSHNLPFENYVSGIEDPDNWFSITTEMHEQLTTLVALGQEGSTLDAYLST